MSAKNLRIIEPYKHDDSNPKRRVVFWIILGVILIYLAIRYIDIFIGGSLGSLPLFSSIIFIILIILFILFSSKKELSDTEQKEVTPLLWKLLIVPFAMMLFLTIFSSLWWNPWISLSIVWTTYFIFLIIGLKLAKTKPYKDWWEGHYGNWLKVRMIVGGVFLFIFSIIFYIIVSGLRS